MKTIIWLCKGSGWQTAFFLALLALGTMLPISYAIRLDGAGNRKEQTDMNQNGKAAEPTPMRPDGAGLAPSRRIDIRELRILHGSQEYRLTLTGKGKLILTK